MFWGVFAVMCPSAFWAGSLFPLHAGRHFFVSARQGGDEGAFLLANTDLRVMLPVAPVFLGNHLLLCFVSSDGKPSVSMAAMITGGLSNVVLGYLFTSPLGMGIFGAVLATGLSPACARASSPSSAGTMAWGIPGMCRRFWGAQPSRRRYGAICFWGPRLGSWFQQRRRPGQAGWAGKKEAGRKHGVSSPLLWRCRKL